MNGKITWILCLMFGLLLLTGSASHAAGPPAQIERPQFVAGEALIKLKEQVPGDSIQDLHRQFNTQTINYFDLIDVYHIKLPAAMSVQGAVAALEQHPLVEYIEPNTLYYLDSTVSDDPALPQMWALNNTGQTGGTPDADIDAPEAWSITTGSPEVVIAVIDSGVDLDHVDLAANLWTNPGEIAGNGLDDDQNGFVDDVHGWDFSSRDNDPSPAGEACRGHGTHVAGTIGAAGNNNTGVAGVNWNVKIMPLKAFTILLDSLCVADTAALIAAIQYYTDMGVHISSNSWGGLLPNLSMFYAIQASDSIFVAAAGNGFLDAIGDNNDETPFYPAGYPLPAIIAVAATDHDDKRATFSNYGPQSVDLGAPGVDILSTLPDNLYGTFSGTSMATPHVAGVVGLLQAQDPTLTNNEIIWRVLNGTDPINLPVLTGGRLNAYQALQFGLSTPAVTIDLAALSPTTVPSGEPFDWRITIVNHEATSIETRFRLYLQFPFGVVIPLEDLSASLEANATISEDITSEMPTSLSPGAKFRIFAHVETALSFDEDWLEYTLGNQIIAAEPPFKIYLPLLMATGEGQDQAGHQDSLWLDPARLYQLIPPGQSPRSQAEFDLD